MAKSLNFYACSQACGWEGFEPLKVSGPFQCPHCRAVVYIQYAFEAPRCQFLLSAGRRCLGEALVKFPPLQVDRFCERHRLTLLGA